MISTSIKHRSPVRPQPTMVVNGRFRVQRITGVQRYAQEIVSRLSGELEVISPRSGKGAIGHLWEQTLLPLSCDGRLLWNPNACGPLGYGRQVVTFHDLFPIEHPEWYSRAYAKWYGIVMRRLAKQAVHLIAVSDYTKNRIVQLLGRSADDITVIHNGCHMQGRASTDQIAQASSALGLPTGRYILSLSSLEQRKNMGSLLAAWAAIQRDLPDDVWLVLAGPKADAAVYGEQHPYGERPQETTAPRVFFTGYVPEQHLNGLYSGASLFVFPSLAEGFGLPLLEAMACGVRCISSNTSSLPEVGGEAVTYIDPMNPGELARAMRDLFFVASASIPFRPSLQQSRLFTWDNAASKTLDVLEKSAHRSALFPTPATERITI